MSRILLVDDSTTMRRILARSLQEAKLGNFEFHEAGNGLQALEILWKVEFGLVISDINMPKLDGVEFVRYVRRGQTPDVLSVDGCVCATSEDVPIVMITTEGANDRVEEAILAGASGALPKPFTPEQIAAAIAPLL